MLTENRVERTVRSNAASPSFRAGLLHDEDAIRPTPTHADEKGRRYPYYVGHVLIARTSASADEDESPRRCNSARRIPANDLEGIIGDRIVAFLRDAGSIDAIASDLPMDWTE